MRMRIVPCWELNEQEKKLLMVINHMWQCLPYEVKYETFNLIFPVNENVNKLRELEIIYPEIGIARYDTDQEGFTIISLMASMTDIMFGKRLGVFRRDDDYNNFTILGFGLTVPEEREKLDFTIETDETIMNKEKI